MERPWVVRGVYYRVRGVFIGCRGVPAHRSHGPHMGRQWVAHGSPVGCRWVVCQILRFIKFST